MTDQITTKTVQRTATATARKYPPGILNYGSLQSTLLIGGKRIDGALRKQAKAADPGARNRRPQEIVYQWTIENNLFWMRLYTTLDADNLVTRAQRTGAAKIRLTVRDAKSKQVVECVSGSIEILRDQKNWETELKTLLDRAYLFVSRNRPICPLCRTAMEVRTGKRGQFWGCQTFPVCRGTRNVPPLNGTGDERQLLAGRETPEKSDQQIQTQSKPPKQKLLDLKASAAQAASTPPAAGLTSEIRTGGGGAATAKARNLIAA